MKKRKVAASPAWDKWRRIIDAQASGGLTIAAYCQRHRIGQASFYAWKRRLKESRRSVMSSRPAEAGFVELTAARESGAPVAATASPLGIEILIGSWRVLVRPGFNRELLGEVIQVLEKQV